MPSTFQGFKDHFYTIKSLQVSIPFLLLLFAMLCLTLCDPMDWRTPVTGLHYLLEFTQIHVHRVSTAIQSSPPHSTWYCLCATHIFQLHTLSPGIAGVFSQSCVYHADSCSLIYSMRTRTRFPQFNLVSPVNKLYWICISTPSGISSSLRVSSLM